MTLRCRYLCAAAIVLCLSGPAVAAGDYVVRPGDTLASIARAHLGDDGRWSQIAQLNGIAPPYAIRVGQRLKLPERTPEERPTRIEDLPAAAPAFAMHLTPALWIWAIAGFAIFLIFTALCLKGGCWFSLVEAKFGKCLWLTLLELLLAGLCLAIFAMTVHLTASRSGAAAWIPAVVGIILLVACAIISLVLTKRILGCKWRSVVTVLVMAGVVQNLILWAVGLVLALMFPLASAVAAAHEWLAMIGH